jgi:hypothetical protein
MSDDIQNLPASGPDEIRTIVPFIVDETSLPYLPYFKFNTKGDITDMENEISIEMTNDEDQFLYNPASLSSRGSKPCAMRIYINRSIRAVVRFRTIRRGMSFGFKPVELIDCRKIMMGAFAGGSINFNL